MPDDKDFTAETFPVCSNPACPNLRFLHRINIRAQTLEEDYRTLTNSHAMEKARLTGEISRLRRLDDRTRPAIFHPVVFQGEGPSETLLREKNDDLARLRNRVAELIEAKTSLEREKENSNFALENARANFSLELRSREAEISRLQAQLQLAEQRMQSQTIRTSSLEIELQAQVESLRRQLSSALQGGLGDRKVVEALGNRRREEEYEAKCLERRLKTRVVFHSENLLEVACAAEERRLVGRCFANWRRKFRENESAEGGTRKYFARGGDRDEAVRRNERSDQKNGENRIDSTGIRPAHRAALRLIVETIFKIFAQSLDLANKKRAASLPIFATNLKLLFSKSEPFLAGLLDAYFSMFEALSSIREEERLFFNPANIDETLLDSGNLFALKSLKETIRSAQNSKGINDPNRPFMPLFQLLMIFQRAEFPKGPSKVRLDSRVRNCLSHEVIAQLQLLLN